MKTFLIKRTYEASGTPGKLYDDLDQLFCYTIERPKDDPDHPCIPEGSYEASRYDSPHNGYIVWLLENVPGRTLIEFHVANFPYELLGCIAPGQNAVVQNGIPGVEHSRAAFDRFMTYTQDETKITFLLEKE